MHNSFTLTTEKFQRTRSDETDREVDLAMELDAHFALSIEQFQRKRSDETNREVDLAMELKQTRCTVVLPWAQDSYNEQETMKRIEKRNSQGSGRKLDAQFCLEHRTRSANKKR